MILINTENAATIIANGIARKHGITMDNVKSRSQLQTYSAARKEIAEVLHAQLDMAPGDIGRVINRHRTSVIYLLKA